MKKILFVLVLCLAGCSNSVYNKPIQILSGARIHINGGWVGGCQDAGGIWVDGSSHSGEHDFEGCILKEDVPLLKLEYPDDQAKH